MADTAVTAVDFANLATALAILAGLAAFSKILAPKFIMYFAALPPLGITSTILDVNLVIPSLSLTNKAFTISVFLPPLVAKSSAPLANCFSVLAKSDTYLWLLLLNLEARSDIPIPLMPNLLATQPAAFDPA